MFERRWLKPRSETSVCAPVTSMMSTPARRRSSSGIFVIPERRMSCSVTIEVELGASSGLCAPRDAVTTDSSNTSSVRAAPTEEAAVSAGVAPGVVAGFTEADAAAPPAFVGAPGVTGVAAPAAAPVVAPVAVETAAVEGAAACAAAACCRRDPCLDVLHDLRDLVAVRRVGVEVLVVVEDRVREVARLCVRAADVVDDARVGEDLVRPLQLGDADLVATVGDRLHPLLEVGSGLRPGIGPGR